MGTEIDDTQLRRFVVRVQTADGESPLGTGVLVAPGWVLTCAHVVEGLNDVRLVPDRGAGIDDAGEPPGNAPPAHVPAAVRARSTPRDPAQRTAFWPFPDLAVLEFDGWTSHVCAPLVTAEPVRTSQPHAWGFGRREDDVASPGGAASFTYVGTDGDGYLALKAGDAAPGLSGAPLVCPQRRGVVALASVSRDPRDARGGWASPVSALAGGGLPGDLALVGGQVLALNREQAWRHRDDWNRVLPVPDAELTVDRPWEGLEFERPAAPSLLLRAEFGIVSYSFRGLDLAAARDWCRTRPRFAISYIDAQGGAGKTRFGIELCKAMSARGWLAGFLPKTGRGVDAVPLARLVVVDYVEEREAKILADQLSALERSASALAPVRVLLLSRPSAGSLAGQALEPLREQPAVSGPVLQAVDTAKDRSAAASGLAPGDRDALFQAALTAFGRAWHGDGWTPPATAAADLSQARYAWPLDVLLEAFDAALSGPHWQPIARPPVDRALDHESRHWAARMPGFPARVRRECVALATLAGARSDAEAAALLDLVPDLAAEPAAAARRQAGEWLHGLYAGPDQWNPLRPDRLGEALIVRVLRERENGGFNLLGAVLDLASDAQVERALEVLVRLAADPAAAGVIAEALAGRYSGLVQRCVRQARGSPGRPGRAGLLDGLARAHLALLPDARISALPLVVQSQVSASADVLADLAREYGRGREALAIYEGVMAIDQRKHELEPGNTTYRRDLSVSYNKLADLALAAGRSGDAEALYRQALAVAQELAELEPGNTTYRRDLSVSYERLADLARAAGRPGDAEALYRQALAVRQELAELEPGNTTYRRDLSVSYNKLADLARAAGRPGDAEALYRQSLAVAQELAELEPGNTTYRRDLSVSYNKLADLARAAGRSGDAEALYRQSLAVAQELAELEPGNTTYRRDLSVSYNKLADLALAAGRSGDAEALYRQALAVRQELAELEPGNTTYRRDLSVSYNKLADLARAAGRSGDAEALYRQALAVAQELAELEPGNTTYRRDLSVSYNKLADLARAAGRPGDAEALYRQALAVAQELAELEPGNTTYRRDLSISYERLADLARAAGRSGDAEALYRQALAVRQELAELEPGNTTYRRDLSISYERLADLARAAGRSGDAEALYRQSLAVRQELAELEPGNTTYRRDLSISYNKLADLALAAGRSGDAEALYRQSLAVAQELAELEPGNTTYRQDLSLSYERLGEIAAESGQAEEAQRYLTIALDMRRGLHRQEPQRVDLAEELGVILYLFAGAVDDQANVRQEIIDVLVPFERAGTITRKGVSLLGWARQSTTK